MMQQQFRRHIDTRFPFLLDQKSLLAVSGGIDSVVLAHLCKNEGLDFALAHCNFQLRDDESDKDEAFVRKLADQLEVKLFVKKFDTKKEIRERGGNTQLTARKLRYQWFGQLCKTDGFAHILTAHHRDDSIETFFINLLRGTGLDGLTGIPPEKGKLLRPLLEFTRKDIQAFAQERKIAWREDRSNASDDYLRNRIRHHIIPSLENEKPSFRTDFSTTLSHLVEAADLLSDYSEKIKAELFHEYRGTIRVNIKKLRNFPHTKAVLYQLFHKFGFTAWDDIHSLLDTQPGKQVLSEGFRLLKDRDELILSENTPKIGIEVAIGKADREIDFPGGRLFCEKASKISSKDKTIAYIAPEKLDFPLMLRLWRPGDRFQPFGMKGHRKLSDFLKDEKLSLFEKENVWVLTSNHKIVWVVGQRIDDRFKVENGTTPILKIKFEQ